MQILLDVPLLLSVSYQNKVWQELSVYTHIHMKLTLAHSTKEAGLNNLQGQKIKIEIIQCAQDNIIR